MIKTEAQSIGQDEDGGETKSNEKTADGITKEEAALFAQKAANSIAHSKPVVLLKKTVTKNRLLWLAFIFCIIFLGLSYAYYRIFTSDFSAVNGDFQNYNVFRRMLAGQVPYRDFTNYLGMGTVFLNVPLLFFKNSFTASLFVTNFTACVVYMLAATVLLYVASKSKAVALAGGALSVPVANYISGMFINSVNFNLSGPGNSMRGERMFLPFLLAGTLLIILKAKKTTLAEFLNGRLALALTGASAGFFMVWSNDFGFASAGAALVTVAALLFSRKKQIKRNFIDLFIFAVCMAAGFFISVCVFSGFRPMSYLADMKGVSDYQFWYFSAGRGSKILSLGNIFQNKTFLSYFRIFVVLNAYFAVRYYMRKMTQCDFLLLYINATAFFAAVIYIYGGGGWAFEAFAFAVAFSVLGLAARFLIWFTKRRYQAHIKTAAFALVFLMLFNHYGKLRDSLRRLEQPRNVAYSEGFGYTKFAADLQKTKDIIGNASYFSIYASAFETINGDFQPTGTDYIIHVMGDEQRERYVDAFVKGKYEYALTMLPSYTPYAAWIKRANWFWYKELLRNYEPVDSTQYNTIWKRLDRPKDITANTELKINKINSSTWELTVTSDSTEELFADVVIDYKSVFISGPGRLTTFRRAVCVDDLSSVEERGPLGYDIPEQSGGYHIPVRLKNGTGKVVISSDPVNCTALQINSARLGGLYPDYALN